MRPLHGAAPARFTAPMWLRSLGALALVLGACTEAHHPVGPPDAAAARDSRNAVNPWDDAGLALDSDAGHRADGAGHPDAGVLGCRDVQRDSPRSFRGHVTEDPCALDFDGGFADYPAEYLIVELDGVQLPYSHTDGFSVEGERLTLHGPACDLWRDHDAGPHALSVKGDICEVYW